MKYFRAYCGLTLLLLATIIFQPFLMMIEYDINITTTVGGIDPVGMFREYEYLGYEYWGAFVFPFISVLVSLLISGWRNLWTGIVGCVIAFGAGLWTIGIIPSLYRNGFLADGHLLIGYDFLRAAVALFFVLNIAHTIAIFRKPVDKKKIRNSDVLDDQL